MLTLGYLVCWSVSFLSFLSGSFSPLVSSSNFPRERLRLVQSQSRATSGHLTGAGEPKAGCLLFRCWLLAQPAVAKVVGETGTKPREFPVVSFSQKEAVDPEATLSLNDLWSANLPKS